MPVEDDTTLVFPMTIFSKSGHSGMLLTPSGRVRLDDGRMFETVSGAATGATGQSAKNGWRFWRTFFGPNQTEYPLASLKAAYPGVFGGDTEPMWKQLDLSGLSLTKNNIVKSVEDVEYAWKDACISAVDDALLMDKKDPNGLYTHKKLEGETVTFQFTFTRRIYRPDIVLCELRLSSRRMPRCRAFQALILPDDPRTIVCYSCDDVSVTLGNGLSRETAKNISQAWQEKVMFIAPIAWEYNVLKKKTRNSDGNDVRLVVIEAKAKHETSDTNHTTVERACLRFVAEHVSCLYVRKDKTHVLKIAVMSKTKK